VVTTLLVERYWPATTVEPAIPGPPIVDSRSTPRTAFRYLGSILVPTDETLFTLFEAVSSEVIREAHERAQASFERIVECTSTFSAASTGSRGGSDATR
jgi:hypothetical protein